MREKKVRKTKRLVELGWSRTRGKLSTGLPGRDENLRTGDQGGLIWWSSGGKTKKPADRGVFEEEERYSREVRGGGKNCHEQGKRAGREQVKTAAGWEEKGHYYQLGEKKSETSKTVTTIARQKGKEQNHFIHSVPGKKGSRK